MRQIKNLCVTGIEVTVPSNDVKLWVFNIFEDMTKLEIFQIN